MKPITPKLSLVQSVSTSSLIALLGLAAPASQAATYYWDQDGTTAGFGAATGTWTTPTVSRWSTSSAGTGTPGASITTALADTLNFGTDTVALGTGSITVTGTVNASTLRFGSATTGNVTLSGGTINLNAAATIHVGAGSTTLHTISSTLTGAGTSLTKTGNTLRLSGNNTFTGQTIISTGTLILNNVTALGGNNPGVNGTSSITMGANTTLQSNYAPADAGVSDSYVYAPITLNAAGTNNFLTGAGSSAAPAESVRLNLNGPIGGSAGANVVFGSTTTNLNNADSIIVLGAASTYNGNTSLQAGNTQNRINVKAGVANALPVSTVLDFGTIEGNGTGRLTQFDLSGFNQTLAGLGNGGVVPNFRNQRITNTGALATLTINNTADFTFGGSTTATNGSGTSTVRAQLNGTLALTKNGPGTFTLGGTLTGGASAGGNTHTGETTILGGILVLAEATALQNSPLNTAGSVSGDSANGLRVGVGGTGVSTLTLGGLTGNKNLADVFTTTSGGYSGLTALTLNPGTGTSPVYSADIGNGAGNLTLIKTGTGTQTIAGAMSHTGNTTVNAGTLTLDYSSQDNSKLSDTAALVLGGGTLNLNGGTHVESVLSTTLTAGTTSYITSGGGAAPIQLNTITPGDSASVDFVAPGIATTDNLNNAAGILGSWATVNGYLATNSTNSADGLITAAVSSDVTRLDGGPQIIADGPTSNIRIVEGTGTAASLTLDASITTVNTLFQTASGGASAATIDSGAQTFRTNAILVGSGAGSLTIGNGTLAAATPGGILELVTTPSASSITVNSVIANNTSASTLAKSGLGSVTLTGANTYDGPTFVNGGVLYITNASALGSTAGATTVNGGNGTSANSLSLTNATSNLTIAENINLSGNASGRAQLSSAGAFDHELTGALNVSSDTNLSQINITGGSLTISGDITGTMANNAVLFLRGTSTSALNRVLGNVNITAGNLAKTDAGTWLVGASGKTYSWVDTLVAVGTLKMGQSGVLPSSSVVIMGNTTGATSPILDLNGFAQTVSGISYSGAGVATGTKTITNSDAVTPAVLTINNAADYASGSATGANNIVLAGNLSLIKQGAGNLTLRGNNTHTGSITVAAGTLTASKNDTLSALGAGSVDIASGATVVVDAVKTTNVVDAVANTFTGSGTLKVQFAPGTTARSMTMTGLAGFNGPVQLSNLGATGDKWNATDAGALPGSLVVDSGSTIFMSNGTNTFAGGITVSGAGNSEGRGALRLSGATTVLGGNISLAGSTTISMENVAAQITGNISGGVAGANTLTLGGTSSTGGILSGNIGDGTGTVAITQAVGSYTLSGVLSHTGGITVTGALLTLTNSGNTYTGVTAITSGSGKGVRVYANNALGAVGAGNETTIAGLGAATVSGSLRFLDGVNYTALEKVIGSGYGDARGFVQAAGTGTSTFAGPIELNADGGSRIGTQDGASLTLTGPITQAAGITTASILFRTGSNNGDFVTLSNSANSFGGNSTVYNALATAGQYAGLRIGVDNAHPTNLTVQNFSSVSGSQTALDLNGKNQALNGLVGNGTGTLNIINLDTVTASSLTLNPTADQNSGANIVILGGSPGGTALGTINLVKEGPFNQTLAGVNSYTGTTTINGGTLTIGDGSIADSSGIVNNAALVYDLNANARTYANVISGTGSLTKSGTNTLTLTGANTYTGNTAVAAGTLSVSGANFANASTVSVATGAVLDLNFVGTDTVASLVLNGVAQTPGVYDAGNTGGLITGTGSITVPTPGPSLSSFKSANFTTEEQGDPAISGPNADPDGDGVSNVLEYAFAMNPKAASRASLPVANTTVSSGSTYAGCVYTRVKGSSDLAFTVQLANSPDSAAFTDAVAGTDYTLVSTVDNGNGTETLTIRDNTPVSGAAKRFLRILVTFP